jgi:hypothetical protein
MGLFFKFFSDRQGTGSIDRLMSANLHDSYAGDYDNQAQACDCRVAEVLFGLCYEFIQPRQRLLDLGIGSGLSAALFAKAGCKPRN